MSPKVYPQLFAADGNVTKIKKWLKKRLHYNPHPPKIKSYGPPKTSNFGSLVPMKEFAHAVNARDLDVQ